MIQITWNYLTPHLISINVLVSWEAGISLLYDWVRYAIMEGYSFCGWIPPPWDAVSLTLIDSGCPVGLYKNNMHTLM